MSSGPKPTLFYTFANHMHWVDMEWLWGYDALPGSTTDMLRFIELTGAKGNVNYDVVGYEKLAVEAPDVLEQLKVAIANEVVQVVGATYAQPYGGFHGGESAVRQHTYGVRRVTHLLGKRPRTFWEEEFHFFPQLPQILNGVGMTHAHLFFPWTWETPIVPREEIPVVWWEGIDGTKILTGTHHALCLHQWPEELEELKSSGDLDRRGAGVIQWLELMPAADWMCRSEMMAPPLLELIEAELYDIRFVTISEYLDEVQDMAEVRRYSMDDVFHGMSLGKNGDHMRRRSRHAEHILQSAEAIASVRGLFEAPYPYWDVYPGWELEEGWRELLVAQHHDIHASEALCAHIGLRSFERSIALGEGVLMRTMEDLAKRSRGRPGRTLIFNPLGWERSAVADTAQGPTRLDLGPFGIAVLDEVASPAETVTLSDGNLTTLKRGDFRIVFDTEKGVINQIYSASYPEGCVGSEKLGGLTMIEDGTVDTFESVSTVVTGGPAPKIVVDRLSRNRATIRISFSLAPECDAVDVTFEGRNLPRPDGGMNAGIQTTLATVDRDFRLMHDHPLGVSTITADATYLKKYPTTLDWMNSPQFFEEVRNPFTSLHLLDLGNERRGVLFIHDGSQQMFRDDKSVRSLLTMCDPWDGEYWQGDLKSRWRIRPHGPSTPAKLWKAAQEFLRPVIAHSTEEPGGTLAIDGSRFQLTGESVAITSLFRAAGERSDAALTDYAGADVDKPYVIRLVEFDGLSADVVLSLPGEVASAARTNLLGEIERDLTGSLAPDGPRTMLPLSFRPHEIVTLYIDLVEGRRQMTEVDTDRPAWVASAEH